MSKRLQDRSLPPIRRFAPLRGAAPGHAEALLPCAARRLEVTVAGPETRATTSNGDVTKRREARLGEHPVVAA